MAGVSLLTLGNKYDVLELFERHSKIMGMPRDEAYTKSFTESLDQYLDISLETKLRFMYGVRDEKSNITAMIGCRIWESLPFATILNMMAEPTPQFNIRKTGLDMCFFTLQQVLEGKGIYKYYALWGARHYNAFKQKWDYLQQGRYLNFTEAVIPANTVPKHSLHYSIMGNRVWNIDLILRCAMLKDEHRLYADTVQSR